MKGIYLTQEAKQEIEAKITELEKQLQLVGNLFEDVEHNHNYISNKIKTHKEILESATILPVEESWDEVEFCYECALEDLQETYPQGVIIQPKQ